MISIFNILLVLIIIGGLIYRIYLDHSFIINLQSKIHEQQNTIWKMRAEESGWERMGRDQERENWRKKLVNLGLANYKLNKKTGEIQFIIKDNF